MNREIVECFKVYKKKKKDEYTIAINNGHEVIPHYFIHKARDKGRHSSKPLISKEEFDKLKAEAGGGPVIVPSITIVDDHIVERLSPDNIDSRDFWKKAVETFPLFSICGGAPEEYTVEGANEMNLKMHVGIGAFGRLIEFLNEEIERKNQTQMLEIGPGYGNVCKQIEQGAQFVTYHAIDVHPLFEHPRIYQTDGNTIPDEIPSRLDVVYAINVFQHLSRKQRSAYYQQIYDRLVPGGVFIFGMFVMTPENEDWPVWGLKDKKGNYYTQFYRQLTEVDRIEDLKSELEGIGFQFENVSLHEDKSNALTFRCTKI